MSETQNTAVIEAFQKAAHKYGIKKMAAELDKSPSTVYSELNPWGDRSKSKLGFEEAIKHSKLHGNVEGWQLAAAELGCAFVPACVLPNRATPHDELAEVVIDFGEFGRVIDDPKATINQLVLATDALITNIREAAELKRKNILERNQ